MARPVRVGRVMCVGLACLDFVNVVAKYPQEDSDQRGLKYYWQSGGNAINTSTVLSVLSTPCDFMGVLGTVGAEATWIINELKGYRISTEHCVYKDVKCPVATVILSHETGSRTIVYHSREQPKLTFEEFDRAFGGDFSAYSWIHFELTSNVADVGKMMDSVRTYRASVERARADSDEDHKENSAVPTKKHKRRKDDAEAGWPSPIVSVELEKPDIADAEQVMNKADVVFISKDFARSRGFNTAKSALEGLYSLCRQRTILICPWADQGAEACYGRGSDNSPLCVSAEAFKDIVVDTLGAGDTFVAAVILSMLRQGFKPHEESSPGSATEQEEEKMAARGKIVAEAIKYGCLVAGVKCGIYGYDAITDFVQ